jgi:hypothetical protein
MNPYQKEQAEALALVRRHLDSPCAARVAELKTAIAEYLAFRQRVGAFLEARFQDICTKKCYQSQLSACCAKDGIITFFADVVVNALVSSHAELELLSAAIARPYKADKCIFLSKNGCTWRLKPVVCEFFLCDVAEQKVFQVSPEAHKQWEILNAEKKAYTWPDQPVLFEMIENEFIMQGYRSPLMYLHNSPGLIRIRRARDESSGTPGPDNGDI